jgi:hypothetical protein
VGSNYAGLLTVDLPGTVKPGEVFSVITRQITNAFAGRPTPVASKPSIELQVGHEPVGPDLVRWRRVLGTFQLSIPVETKAALLAPEERLLSVLRWIAEGIPHQNRWHPVMRRYLEQIAGRVSALGGDPSAIAPSSRGDGGRLRPRHERREGRLHYSGKVAGLMFDRFGDFEGFLLDTEDGERILLSREREIEKLVERAWRERLRITVTISRDDAHQPDGIVVHQPPASFED